MDVCSRSGPTVTCCSVVRLAGCHALLALDDAPPRDVVDAGARCGGAVAPLAADHPPLAAHRGRHAPRAAAAGRLPGPHVLRLGEGGGGGVLVAGGVPPGRRPEYVVGPGHEAPQLAAHDLGNAGPAGVGEREPAGRGEDQQEE
jgi:hypothetical protein